MKNKIKHIVLVLALTFLIGCSKNSNMDVYVDEVASDNNIETESENNLETDGKASLDKPLIYMKFDENSSYMTKDSSGYLEEGYINYVFNVAKYQENRNPQWFERGIEGSALLFDGYSTYLDYDDGIDSESLSVVVWIAPRAFEWGDKGLPSTIISQYNSTAMEGFQFGIYRHGSFGVEVDTETEFLKCYSLDEKTGAEEFVQTYEWTQLAFVYDAATGDLTLYKDGNVSNEITSKTDEYNPIKSSLSSLMIGKNNESTAISAFSANMFNGLMDELKVYDYALSDGDIKELYNNDLVDKAGQKPELAFEDIALNTDIVTDDINRPIYHFGAPQHWMNEPHGAFFYNGYYHLFYQHNPFGPFWHQIHWGHAVSTDMIHWEHLPVALSPEYDSVAPDGIWSGSSVLDRDGNPVIFFTAGNDSKVPNQSVGIAKPKDLSDPYLTEWEMEEVLVVEQGKNQGKLGEFRDPYVWYDKESDAYFMLVGTGLYDQGGTSLLYESVDLYEWEYQGPFLISDYEKYPFLGQQWELPTFFTLSNEEGMEKDIFLFNPHGDGANKVVYYFLGDFDKETMTFIKEDEEPRKVDLGHYVFSGPSGFEDPNSGKSILFTIAQGDRESWDEYFAGWAHNGGMPVELSLDSEGNLAIQPISQVDNLHGDLLLEADNISMADLNDMLENVQGDALDIQISIQESDADEFGLLVRATKDFAEKTEIYYDSIKGGLYVNRLNSSLDATHKDITGDIFDYEDMLNLRILIDRSLIEIYVNNERSLTTRVYPTLEDADGIMIHLVDDLIKPEDIIINNIKIYAMNGID